MDADRLRTGELIAAVSAVALFIIMFLPWFGVGGVAGEALEQAQDLGFAGEVETSANAWESFDFIDLVLLVTIVIAVGLAVATMAAQTVALPVAASAITAGLGVLSTLLILYRIIDPPGDADRKFWIFLGLIAAAGIAYGGWRAMQEEGTSFGGEADRVRGRGEPPPPSAPPPPPLLSQGPAA
jgi:quinol-cytochrome oxidoreductase complex cytochrome b subunit